MEAKEAPVSGVLAEAKAFLEEAGWVVALGGSDPVFGLDLLCEDKRAGVFFMGIEFDSPSHPLLGKARAREIWRPGVLEREIGAIYRVSSKAWYENPAGERKALMAAVQRAFRREGDGGVQ